MKEMVRAFRRVVGLALVAALVSLLAPVEGFAQYGKVPRSMVKLSSSDLEIIRKLVRQDLTGKPKGTTLPWSNPQSQNSGSVTLLDSFPSQGRECRRVRYEVKPGPTQAPTVIPATYVLTNCRLADGTWKMDSQAKPDRAK